MSDESEKVVKLVQHKGGVPQGSSDDLFAWLRQWTDAIETDQDKPKSFILVVETVDGNIYQVAQSIERNDITRVVGLLDTVKHRVMDGCAKHPSLDV